MNTTYTPTKGTRQTPRPVRTCLKQLRLYNDLTLEEAAQAIGQGLRQQHLSQYETGKHTPGLQWASILADFYCVTLDQLFTPEFDPEKKNIPKRANKEFIA